MDRLKRARAPCPSAALIMGKQGHSELNALPKSGEVPREEELKQKKKKKKKVHRKGK